MTYYVEVAYTENNQGLLCGWKFEKQSIRSILAFLNIPLKNSVGVDGKIVDLEYVIDKNCRIAVYPDLRIDPIEKRKRLVENKRRKSRT